MGEREDLEQLVLRTAQGLATAHARQDALQAVLTATLIALSRSNHRGGAQIEQMALRFSEGIAASKGDTAYSDEVLQHTDTILATVRVALSGKVV